MYWAAKDQKLKRANLITDIVKSIAIIPDAIIRSEYIKECSNILKVKEAVLYSETDKIRRKKAEATEKKHKTQHSGTQASIKPIAEGRVLITNNVFEILEKEIVRLLLMYGKNILDRFDSTDDTEQTISVAEFIIDELINDEIVFMNPLYDRIVKEYQANMTNEKFDTKYFVHHNNEEITKLTADLLSTSDEISKKYWARSETYIQTEEMKLKFIVPDALTTYKYRKIEIILNETNKKTEELQKCSIENKDFLIQELQEQTMTLNNLRKKLSEKLRNSYFVNL